MDNVVRQNPHTIPNLVEYLWDKFLLDIQQRIKQHRAKNPRIHWSSNPLTAAMSARGTSSAELFRKFCVDFLAEHRPVETSFVAADHAIRLSNNDLVTISPSDVGEEGAIQDAGALAITHGRTQPQHEGTLAAPSIPI
jgi:hypothetical protein